MSHTNSTSNYNLPQWIGTDKPTFLGDFNTAFYDIDAQMKNNADAAASATTTANTAASAATTASTNATTALNTANSAASEAASATSAAASATATANTAAANAATALTASQANNIANLAPAYDPTLTYAVGDLVTYVDTETNTGKLYKCIIAVVSPEAFNINKWDDVTTSEVYTKSYHDTVSIIADGVDSTDTVFSNLFSHIDMDKVNFESYLIYTNGDLSTKFNMNSIDRDNNILKLSNMDGDTTATYFSIISMKITGSYRIGSVINNTPTVLFVNHVSDPADAGTYTFYY